MSTVTLYIEQPSYKSLGRHFVYESIDSGHLRNKGEMQVHTYIKILLLCFCPWIMSMIH